MAQKKNATTSLLLCPICKLPLEKHTENHTYTCKKNHSYDIAKQGYTNLLISNQKKSNHPGESKEQIKVRREFLDQGFYEPVSAALNEALFTTLKSLKMISPISILDLGCGEGYYLHQLGKFLGDKRIKSNNFGLDISKEAIKLASSRPVKAEWFVGSNFHTPFASKSLSFILSVFSPISDDEISRLLGKQGCFIRVLPNANHLIELRELIYTTIQERREGTINPKNLKCLSETNVSYTIKLNKENIERLLHMTPHFWKTSKENQEKIYELDELEITIDMNIGVFTK